MEKPARPPTQAASATESEGPNAGLIAGVVLGIFALLGGISFLLYRDRVWVRDVVAKLRRDFRKVDVGQVLGVESLKRQSQSTAVASSRIAALRVINVEKEAKEDTDGESSPAKKRVDELSFGDSETTSSEEEVDMFGRPKLSEEQRDRAKRRFRKFKDAYSIASNFAARTAIERLQERYRLQLQMKRDTDTANRGLRLREGPAAGPRSTLGVLSPRSKNEAEVRSFVRTDPDRCRFSDCACPRYRAFGRKRVPPVTPTEPEFPVDYKNPAGVPRPAKGNGEIGDEANEVVCFECGHAQLYHRPEPGKWLTEHPATRPEKLRESMCRDLKQPVAVNCASGLRVKWRSVVDPTGHKYWYNPETKQSLYERPPLEPGSIQEAAFCLYEARDMRCGTCEGRRRTQEPFQGRLDPSNIVERTGRKKRKKKPYRERPVHTWYKTSGYVSDEEEEIIGWTGKKLRQGKPKPPMVDSLPEEREEMAVANLPTQKSDLSLVSLLKSVEVDDDSDQEHVELKELVSPRRHGVTMGEIATGPSKAPGQDGKHFRAKKRKHKMLRRAQTFLLEGLQTDRWLKQLCYPVIQAWRELTDAHLEKVHHVVHRMIVADEENLCFAFAVWRKQYLAQKRAEELCVILELLNEGGQAAPEPESVLGMTSKICEEESTEVLDELQALLAEKVGDNVMGAAVLKLVENERWTLEDDPDHPHWKERWGNASVDTDGTSSGGPPTSPGWSTGFSSVGVFGSRISTAQTRGASRAATSGGRRSPRRTRVALEPGRTRAPATHKKEGCVICSEVMICGHVDSWMETPVHDHGDPLHEEDWFEGHVWITQTGHLFLEEDETSVSVEPFPTHTVMEMEVTELDVPTQSRRLFTLDMNVDDEDDHLVFAFEDQSSLESFAFQIDALILKLPGATRRNSSFAKYHSSRGSVPERVSTAPSRGSLYSLLSESLQDPSNQVLALTQDESRGPPQAFTQEWSHDSLEIPYGPSPSHTAKLNVRREALRVRGAL